MLRMAVRHDFKGMKISRKTRVMNSRGRAQASSRGITALFLKFYDRALAVACKAPCRCRSTSTPTDPVFCAGAMEGACVV